MPEITTELPQLDAETFAHAIGDPALRKALVKQFGFGVWFLIYLSHYFELEPADFFPELIQNLDDDELDALLVIGFRGSAKSTFVSTAYAIYAALEKSELYPFIVLLVSTGDLATSTIAAVKREFESNEALKEDYGIPTFEKVRGLSWEVRKKLESKEEWQARNLLLSTGIRILARSRGQRIRGIRHGIHRPKLVIGDDIDDLKSVQTQESRNATARWWQGEVIGALALKARRILIGNWLHLDGLMARMKDSGRYKILEFALLREGDGTEWERCTWKAAYPDQESIDKKRWEMGDIAFRREMLLQVVPEEGQDVLPEDIHYYDDPPFDDGNYLANGTDLAISTKESADCTANVQGEITYEAGRLSIYVQPNPLNERLTFHEAMDAFDGIRHAIHHAKVRKHDPHWPLSPNESVREENGELFVYASYTMSNVWFVEAVQYQLAAVQEMDRRGFAVTPMHPIKDKRARLRIAARYIKNGTVKFPRRGCELLINQLLGFGSEKHDDLVDGLVWLILGVVGDGIEEQKVHYV